jgi:hypothetical protein
MSYDLFVDTFTADGTRKPTGNECAIFRDELVRFLDPPLDEWSEPIDDDWEWAGIGRDGEGGDLIGGLEDTGFSINRPPLYDKDFVDAIFRICIRANCCIMEPATAVMIVFNQEQEDYYRNKDPELTKRINSAKELNLFYGNTED